MRDCVLQKFINNLGYSQHEYFILFTLKYIFTSSMFIKSQIQFKTTIFSFASKFWYTCTVYVQEWITFQNCGIDFLSFKKSYSGLWQRFFLMNIRVTCIKWLLWLFNTIYKCSFLCKSIILQMPRTNDIKVSHIELQCITKDTIKQTNNNVFCSIK